MPRRAQVGQGETEHNYWGRPELETHERPAYTVDPKHKGSEPVAEAAAAMAAGYLVFKDHGESRGSLPACRPSCRRCLCLDSWLQYDTHMRVHAHERADHLYAEELLSHAKSLFDIAFKNQGICPFSQPFYTSTGFLDELAYAAGTCVCYVCVSWRCASQIHTPL